MSATDPFATPAAPPPPKTRRLRRFVFASALLVTGGVIGAVVAGPERGQGWGGPPWYGPPMHHGWGGDRHVMGGPGDRMFFPGRIERGVDRLGWVVDASS